MTTRIAMWSGPRNISTALMRSFENRADCTVVDEPFYACFLKQTAIAHPMAEEVIASQPNDWHTVAQNLSRVETNSEIFYQKHMTHHMLAGVDLAWTRDIRHCFLILHPKYVVSSYAQKRASVSTEDIGIIRQLELYQQISDICGQDIPVIDARRILENPSVTLKSLCRHLGIPFCDEMLTWPAGRRDSDGIWARHWYGAVEQSHGFKPFAEPGMHLNDEQLEVVKSSEPAYEKLLLQCI